MTCPHCEEKDDRISWLESELGLQQDADAYRRLRNAFTAIAAKPTSGRGQPAQMMLALYRAGGRPMTRLQIMEAVPSKTGNDDRCPSIVTVWAVVIRAAFGRDAIAALWGGGYYLTEAGMARVSEILNPQARAA